MPRHIAPYGSWKSPITSELIVSETIGLGQLALDGEDAYWVEMRPAEGGRSAIVRRTAGGAIEDVTPPGFSARTRAHEYGGGAYAVADSLVLFSNDADQRLYRQRAGMAPEAVTEPGAWRYADAILDRARGRLICVREDHSGPGEPVNALCAVDLEGRRGPHVLASGHDFYAAPRLSPDGQRLAWLAWDHPNMPWDGTELWVAPMQDDGTLAPGHRVAGGPEESIFQPEWSPDGTLYFVSDRGGWWNLQRLRAHGAEPLAPRQAEFGLPQWVFGMSTYAFASAERIVCAYNEAGTWRLGLVDTGRATLEELATPYTYIADVRATRTHALFIAGAAAEPTAIVRLDLERGKPTVLRRSSKLAIDPSYVSPPQTLRFPSGNGQHGYAFFHPPANRDYVAPAGTRPPLIVASHGGPTSAVANVLNLKCQFFTSRGFAFLAVNYGGSTGYGRAYRERLNGKWGIVDVEDCLSAARHLIERGQVDPERLAITGGSAGGYTVLCALTFHDLFKAGASYYGVSDLEALAQDTHKFESHYLDRLVGPYPERRDLYRARSPIHFVDRLSRPIIFFQGLEDRVVPPNQTEKMVQALRAQRLPVAYLAFAGEQHGFRRAEHIQAALDAELYFYARVFGLALADPPAPVPIENL